MLLHSLLALCVMIDLNPLPFLPDTQLTQKLNGPGPVMISIAGLLYYIAANIIRWRSVRELKESFEKEVIIKSDHHLITSGPYQFFRHPIYVGNIFAELSIGVTLMYWPLILFPLIISFPLWHLRVMKEEQMLVRNYPVEYRDYICCVKRWGFF
jgi:protein-S-isoprenylcysteine O-methyltransferase Ste14